MLMTKNAYEPKDVESKWSKNWLDKQVFNLEVKSDRPNYSIALPPPNITGNLHMGHALNGTIQDVLIRWKRMQGYNVLWQPGTDHAGIATQMVVERDLKKEGMTRHQLGREAFLERVWKWRKEYGATILNQYTRLGVSFTWERVAFTMDDYYVKAIMKAFVTLFKEGYIYRGNRITNWCPRCQTSVSDLEVEHQETKGQLYLIKYMFADAGTGAGAAETNTAEGLTVATTRPETLFGDVAVAVHPEDERYKSFIGKSVLLPLTNRAIPVIADSYVEREFGTGCLKITPAHDANDWEVGQRYKLEQPQVIDLQGKLIACDFVPAQFQGQERFVARKAVVEALQEAGLMVEVKDYINGVAHCERCHTVIEPSLTDQWYVRMKELAEPAIKVVEEDRIHFVPRRYAATYLDWMQNIKDWCVSRQLWWGHRIPIWTCTECNFQDAFEQAPLKCSECGGAKLEQDADVLDTWFSSALWPFATLGWPEQRPEMQVFFPTNTLVTAREIINLWVARMIFMSLKLTGTIPFKYVLIHPVIQTSDGKRMSKSKGNAVDPLIMIDKYGADAARFWLATVGILGDQDVRFHETRLEEYKHFANKLWNAGRFVGSQLEGYEPHGVDDARLSLADRWILHHFEDMLRNVNEGLAEFDFNRVCKAIYDFTWDQFCDWYVEFAKIQIANEKSPADNETRKVLHMVFEGILRALHPIMPFITEELWSQTPKWPFLKDLDSIMFAPYPRADERYKNSPAQEKIDFVIRVTRSIRNIRQTYNVPASLEAEVIIVSNDQAAADLLDECRDFITRNKTKVNPLKIVTKETMGNVVPKMAAYEIVSTQAGSATIYVPLGDLIDVEKTRAKLNERKQALLKEMAKVNEVLDNPDFVKRAPEEKVNTIKAQKADLESQLASIEGQFSVLQGN